ncbi:hypothetical protein [Burkholderia sp. BCC1993]|uniref:hypothetical protein n=1 Tax=Burkholderia sp. BCC1993 TaxID=2817444 RepID=UPI002AAF26A1|nr:hypothetical protein [Burkholderia sp. BCC1993]
MNLDCRFSTEVIAALFAIMNPTANIPVFPEPIERAVDTMRRTVALAAAIGVSIDDDAPAG